MNDPESLGIDNLPPSIADKLSGVSQRIRRILFLRGLFTVLSISLVTLLGVMVIDAATLLFSSGIRWLLSLSAFAVIAFSIFWYMVRPLKRKRSLSEIARILETRNDALSDERISSTVEILSRQYSQGEAFSPVLLKQLVADAEKDAEVILPRQLFTLKSAKRMMISLGVIGFVYLLIFGIWPGSSARLFVRAVAPFAEVGSAMADRLTIQPGDVRIAVGDPLTIEVGLEKAPSRDVELRTQWAGQPEMVETMQSTQSKTETAVFRTGFPRVNENFAYRIRSGHALSRFYKVQVFPRPEISNVNLHISPPAYTGLDSYRETSAPGRVQILAGSEVEFGIESQTVLASAELILDSVSLGEGKVSSSGDRSIIQWIFPVQGPARSFDWRVEMKSRDGFENKPVRNHVFAIVGDEAPDIERIQPVSPKLELPPDGFLTLEYQLQDDYGVSRCELHISVDGGEKEMVVDAKAGKKHNGFWPVNIPLYLQSLNIDGARSLDVKLVVYDNLPEDLNGPQKAESEGFRILLEQGQENFVHQQVKQQHERAKVGLENIIRRLEQLSRDAHEIQNHLEKSRVPEAIEKTGGVRSGLVETELQVRTLVTELEHGIFDIIAVGLEEVADHELQKASGLGERLPLADETAEQKDIAAGLKSTIDDALRKVKGLEALNESMADDALRLAEIEELSRQQDDLVEQVNEENWEENIEAWQAQQQALADELAALTEADQKLQELAENAQNAAENMQDAAKDAQEAAALAEDIALPPWMIAQDKALQAQYKVLAAQELAIKAQDLAIKTELAGMSVHQQRVERSQTEADIAQDLAEKAQFEALRLLREEAASASLLAQEQANALQAAAKKIQLQADTQQQYATQIRTQESQKETPDFNAVLFKQDDAKKVEQRAYMAQQQAIAQQKLALEVATPDLDQALMDVVEQQQAAQAAQEAANEAQETAREAAEQAQQTGSSEDHAAAERAQEAATEAQEQAATAQEAASEAQPQSAATQSQTAAHASAEAAEAAAAAATQAAEAAAEAGLPEVAEELNDLAEEAQAAADAVSDAAQQPGLPSNNETMAQSAEQMSRIAEALADLAPPAPNETATDAMATAAAQAAQAAQSDSQNQAAAQAAAAAQALQQAAQSVAQDMGMEAPPSQSSSQSAASESTKGGKDNDGPNDEEIPEWVSDIGLSSADWVRMRTLSDPDGASIDDSGIPREYRQLVRDYFMELNREQKDAPKK